MKHDFSVGALHGDMDQRARMAMLESFRRGKLKLLVASDVAARGLDIPDVSHVFNFDVPTHAEDYVHRIGRTGRAGRSGRAFTIVTRADRKYVDGIEKLIGQEIEWLDGDLSTLTAEDEADEKPRRGGRSERGDRKRDRKPSREKAEERPAEKPRSAERPAEEDDGKRQRKEAIRSANEQRERGKHKPREREADTPIGFGDDIPDFMKTPGKV
jgi:superfamily II DNA/RNA helicase